MLILLLFLLILIIGFVIVNISERLYENHRKYITTCEWIENIGVVFIVVGIVSLCVALLIIFFSYVDSFGAKEMKLAEREALVFQLENHVYEYHSLGADIENLHIPEASNLNNNINSFTLVEGKHDLYIAITEFNKNVAYYKSLNNSVWTNVFFPNYWNEIELIPLQ